MGIPVLVGVLPMLTIATSAPSPYAPGGEYVKDHCIVRANDGAWHLFSISGKPGTDWTNSRSDECFSHSVSLDLQDWRFLGHVLGARGGDTWNASKIWAPHVIEQNGEFWMFFTGVQTNGKHIESIGIARSRDLVNWDEYDGNPVWECPAWGSGHDRLRPCRDPMIFRDEESDRWILYYTTYYDNDSTKHAVAAAVSHDLIRWKDVGAVIKRPSDSPNSLTESCFLIKRSGTYYAFLNDGYALSRNPLKNWSEVRPYSSPPPGGAGEVLFVEGKWLRSVVVPSNNGGMALAIVEVNWDGDRISFSDFHGVTPSPPPPTGFVTARGRNLWLDGQLFYPYGTCYRPLYGQPLFGDKDWFTNYEPEKIDRDLDLMAAAGLNVVRIMASTAHLFELRDRDWANEPTPDTSYRAHLQGFLRRCGDHGIRVHLFTNYAAKGNKHGPIHLFQMNSDRQKREEALDCLRKLIRECDLAENPNLLAYEIDWEPKVGGEQLRNSPPGIDLWNRWLRDRYGSADEAVRRWQYEGESTVNDSGDRIISAPLDREIRTDGPWTRKSIAYRRFIEDMVNRRQAYIHRAVRQLDPNHMVTSQRVYFGAAMDWMTQLVFPTRTALMFLDYVGFTFSPHVTWARQGAEWYPEHETDLFKEGYATAVATDGRPVIFTEYGRDTLWDSTKSRPDKGYREASQAEHIRWMHTIALDSGAAGILVWWWQGQRPMNPTDGEISDWGVIRPDGTPRPAYKVLKEDASIFRSASPIRPLRFVPIDPYRHAAEELRFEEGKEAYWQAREAGEYIEFRDIWWNSTSRQIVAAETDDAVIPLVGLNGLFYSIVGELNGSTEDIWDGRQLVMESAGPMTLKVTVANTGNALWLADRYCTDGTGAVRLAVTVDGETRQFPLNRDVPRGDFFSFETIEIPFEDRQAESRVSLGMLAVGGGGFGERIAFSITRKS